MLEEGDSLFEEMKQLRKECRILNSEINCYERKSIRKTQKFNLIQNSKQEINCVLEEMNLKIDEYGNTDENQLIEEVEILNREISAILKQQETLSQDISRIQVAIKIQQESQMKQDFYGQIQRKNIINKSVTNKREQYILALKQSLELELSQLRQEGSSDRTQVRKLTQIARASDLLF